MEFDTLKNQLPDYAKDIRLNLSTLLNGANDTELSQQQLLGVALASAYATQQPQLIQLLENYTQSTLEPATLQAAKIAATLMAMTNVYYRFTHLVTDKDYATLPANLRMNMMAKPGVDKVEFELYALAVSAINGCGMCMNAHVKTLNDHGLSKTAIQTSIRIAATVNAAAQSLAIETTQQ